MRLKMGMPVSLLLCLIVKTHVGLCPHENFERLSSVNRLESSVDAYLCKYYAPQLLATFSVTYVNTKSRLLPLVRSLSYNC